MTPAVSVICTFLNAEDTLDAALDSLHTQSFQNAQFLLVDDGSSDRSGAIARRYCELDGRFVLCETPVHGRPYALNLAVQKAQSDFVAVLDADDVAHPAWIETGIQSINAHPEFAVIGFARLFIRADEQPRWPGQDQIDDPVPINVTRALARENPICHSGVFIRRAHILQVGCYNVSRNNLFDYDLWIRLARAGRHLGRSPLVRIAKRYHRGQKFAHTSGYFLAGLNLQLHAIVANDPDYRNGLAFAIRAVKHTARNLKRALPSIIQRR